MRPRALVAFADAVRGTSSAAVRRFASRHGSGQADLVDVDGEVNIAWKGTLALDDVVDSTFFAGKTGEHFEMKLLDCASEPKIPATVRHIDRMVIHLVGREPLPDCT